MSENRVIYRCALLAALFLLLASIIHFLNINEALVGLKTGDIAKTYAASVTGMWIFGGMSMLLLGIWVLFLAVDLKRRSRRALWQAAAIGVSLSGFAIGCWILYPTAFHFLYFLLPGLLLLAPLLFSRRSRRSKEVKESS